MVGILFRQNMHLDVYGVLYTPELCRLGQLALAQYNIFLVKLGTLVGSMTSTVFSSDNKIYHQRKFRGRNFRVTDF